MKKTLLTLALVLSTIISYGQMVGIGIHGTNEQIALSVEGFQKHGNLLYGGNILMSFSGPQGTYYNRSYGFSGDRTVGTQKSVIGLGGTVGIKINENKDGNTYLLFEPVFVSEDNKTVYYDHSQILGSSTGNRYTTNNGYTEYDGYFQLGLLNEMEDNKYIKVVGGVSAYGEPTFGLTIGYSL
jgi:hypothetical protein